MIKRLFWDERGDLSFFTIFVILSINMVMAFLLLFATILNNVSARIYADTFHSQREANLDSYMGDLYFSSAYQDALRTDFIQGLTDRIVLENENYTLSNIRLDFSQHGNDSGKIEYIFSCDAQFRFQMFGEAFPPFSRHITLTGSHNTKY